VVLMEAMALRRPVLATYVAGIPELLEDGRSGWLFTPGDIAALAQAIERCLDATPEELAAMGARARLAVLAAHDVDLEVGRLHDLFERVHRAGT
jgi:colanic acid/amylovoran biosynthesis glycosyltransferase